MSIDGDWVALTPLRLVTPARQRAGENVVLVGRDDEAIDRQAHALGVIAGQHVAEIAGRDGEGHRPLRRAERDRGDEIIDDLGEDAGPVDGIDARQAHLVAEGEIAEQVLDDALAVVERALDRQRMDVGLADRRHLPALHVGHASVRIEDENVDLGLAGEGLDRRRAGVAGGRAEDGRPRAALASTRFIAGPSHCMAKSLNASVGPWKSSSANRLSSI